MPQGRNRNNQRATENQPMKKTVAIAFAGAALLATPAFPQETATAVASAPAPAAAATDPSAKPEDTVQSLAGLGKGVHKVKKTDDGHFRSCVVVGQARISTALGAAKGMMTAQRNAKLDAESAFVMWLKSNTKSVEQSGDKTEFVLKGDETGSSESASSTETSSSLVQTTAEGAIRGLSLIGKDVSGEILTLVYGWKPDYAEITREVAAEMNKEPEAAAQSAPPQPAPVAPAVQIRNTVIQNTVIVSEEAGDFL